MEMINIFGVKENIGCSHLSVLLTRFLKEMGYDAAYYGDDRSKAAEFGAPIADSLEESSVKKLDYVVADHGTDFSSKVLPGANVIVSGVKPNEKQKELDARQFSAAKDAIIVKNFADLLKSGELVVPWNEDTELSDACKNFCGMLMTACLPKLEAAKNLMSENA